MYLHKTKNGHYTPPCCYFSGELEVVEILRAGICGNEIGIHEEFLPIGRCCYCGWDNELEKCDRCGQLVDVDVLENGLCPSCSAYIDKQ